MRSQTERWLLASALALSGCSGPTETADADAPNAGELGLGIVLGNGRVTKVDYVITGSGGFSKLGSVDVSKSSRVATRIGALPAAAGYTIVLSADATDPPSTCTGSAGFEVTPGETTPVDVPLQCVEINAEFNTCPTIDGLSALPSQVALGGVVTLSADVRDPDSGPSPLAYTWSTSSGTLSASGSSATLTCNSDGVATVTLLTGDGDANCTTSQNVSVTCGEPATPVAQGVPLPTPFIALLGAELLALGVWSGRRRKRVA